MGGTSSSRRYGARGALFIQNAVKGNGAAELPDVGCCAGTESANARPSGLLDGDKAHSKPAAVIAGHKRDLDREFEAHIVAAAARACEISVHAGAVAV